jgi:hypothetical protein
MKKYSILFSLFLVACGHDTIRPPEDNSRPIHIDERLLVPCKPLGLLIDNPQPSDVIKQHGQDVFQYADCAKSKQDLIDVVNKAFKK